MQKMPSSESAAFTVFLIFGIVQIRQSAGEFEQDMLDFRLAGIPLRIPQTSGHILESYQFLKSSEFKDKKGSSLMEVLQNMNRNLNISEICQGDLERLTKSAAFPAYVDASAKIPNGILLGNFNWMGEYQECMEIPSVVNNLTGKSFSGKYFVAALYINGKPVLNGIPILTGLCLPDSCDITDVNTTVNNMILYFKAAIAPFYQNITSLDLKSVGVIDVTDRKLDNGSVAVIAITGVIVFIVLVATLIDYGLSAVEVENDTVKVLEEDIHCSDSSDRTGLLSAELFSHNIQEGRCPGVKGTLLRICRVFSVVSNGKKLFGTETAVGPLACLNGLRVMSMWWVILGHTYAFAVYVSDNMAEAANFIKRFTFQPILNGTFSVDSFFFLSGLLVAYLALKEISEKGGLNWAYYVLHRYWRLTPLYAYIILYNTYLSVPTISGPNRAFVDNPAYQSSIEVCKTYWWTNLLYINNMYPNYGNLGNTCVGWGWYLANDMQFYLVLGPVVILTLSLPRKKKFIGIGLACFLIAAGVAVRGFLVWYYGIIDEINGTPTKHTDDPWGKNGALYGRPYARFSVYLVGMLTGYILAASKNRVRIPRLAAVLGWCTAIATALAVIYGQYHFYHTGTKMTLTQSAFYVAFSRTAWGMSLSWVVLACVSGNGGPVKDILSWKFWAPLGRLTYAAYLVHPIVIFTYYYNMRQVLHIYDLNMIYLFISHLVVSYLVAFVVSMLVEAPMIQLEKIMLGPFRNLGGRVRSVFGRICGCFCTKRS